MPFEHVQCSQVRSSPLGPLTSSVRRHTKLELLCNLDGVLGTVKLEWLGNLDGVLNTPRDTPPGQR